MGTERIWYLRIFQNATLSADELVSLTRRFIGRYVVLGLLLFVVVWPAIVLLSVRPTGWVIYVTLWLALIDMALTFVTPALAFGTRSVLEAIGVGWTMLRETWPRCAWYVLAPPLAIGALARVLPRSSLNPLGSAIVGVCAYLAGLWFKGATAAFYLRRYPSGVNGAAFDRRP